MVFSGGSRGEQEVNEETLKRDLEIYYKGLSRAVGGSRKLNMDLSKVSAEVAKAGPESKGAGKGVHQVRLTARLKTYDAFATGRLLDLRIEISKHYFPEKDRTWVWFSVSPKGGDDPVWGALRAMRDSFEVRK